jgi:hypothetical protein
MVVVVVMMMMMMMAAAAAAAAAMVIHEYVGLFTACGCFNYCATKTSSSHLVNVRVLVAIVSWNRRLVHSTHSVIKK